MSKLSKYNDQLLEKPGRDSRDRNRREAKRSSFNKKLAHKRLEVEIRLSDALERGARVQSKHYPFP